MSTQNRRSIDVVRGAGRYAGRYGASIVVAVGTTVCIGILRFTKRAGSQRTYGSDGTANLRLFFLSIRLYCGNRARHRANAAGRSGNEAWRQHLRGMCVIE